MGSLEIYRQTMLGDCIVEALEEMMDSNKLTSELATTIAKQFDSSMMEALQNQVQGRATIKADLKHYRYFDNVWQFSLEDVTLKLNPTGSGSANSSIEVSCDRAKVICVDAKLIEEQPGGAPAPAAQAE